MIKNLFLARAAKATLALAAVVMMSTMFTSCSKYNNDDNGGGVGTVTLDGVEKTIIKAEYKDKGGGDYALYLLIDDNGKEGVTLALNKGFHITGNPIKLGEKEKVHTGFYWVVEYVKPDGNKLIDTFGKPGNSLPVFNSGTLTVSGDPAAGTISIKLENGSVIGLDNVEHTLTLSYSGKIHKKGELTPEPLPEPKAQTVTLDGVEKPIVKALYEDKGRGNYELYLNLSADGKEKVEIDLNKDLHITNIPIDLIQKEENHINGEFYWLVAYYKSQNNKLIFTFGNPYAPQEPVFKTGILTVSGDPAAGTVSIKLENGRVIGTDKKNHTLTLSYSGSITKKQ